MEIKFNILCIIDDIINELDNCKAGKKVRILNIGCGIPIIYFEIIFHLITHGKEHLLKRLELINTDKEDTENEVNIKSIILPNNQKIGELMRFNADCKFKDIIHFYLNLSKVRNTSGLFYNSQNFLKKYEFIGLNDLIKIYTPILSKLGIALKENNIRSIEEFKDFFDKNAILFLPIDECIQYYEKISNYKKMDIIEDFNLYETLCTTEEDKFSVIICEQLLHFKSIRNKTLQIIELFSKLIKPRGHIIVRVNHDKNTIKNSDKSNQYNLFSESEFNDLFREYPNIVPTDNLQKTNKWISQFWKYQKKRQNNLK